MTSASNAPSPTAVAVRQAPLTATESPSARSETRPAPIRRRAPSSEASIASTRPSSLMIPVNISRSPLPQPRAHEHVLADLLEAGGQRPEAVGDPDRALPLEDRPRLRCPDQNGSDEQPQLVDLARVKERAGEGRTALNEQVLDVATPKLSEPRLEPIAVGAPGRDDHLGSGALQRVALGRWCLRGADHDQRGLVDGGDQRRVDRQPRARV